MEQATEAYVGVLDDRVSEGDDKTTACFLAEVHIHAKYPWAGPLHHVLMV